eukprot:g3728.t1
MRILLVAIFVLLCATQAHTKYTRNECNSDEWLKNAKDKLETDVEKEVYDQLKDCYQRQLYIIFGTNAVDKECVNEDRLKKVLSFIWRGGYKKKINNLEKILGQIETKVKKKTGKRYPLPLKFDYLKELLQLLKQKGIIVSQPKHFFPGMEALENSVKTTDKKIEELHDKVFVEAFTEYVKEKKRSIKTNDDKKEHENLEALVRPLRI